MGPRSGLCYAALSLDPCRACLPTVRPMLQRPRCGGARRDARGCGRAVTVCGALHGSEAAVVVARCPGVPAVDGGTAGTRRGPRTAGCGRRGLETGRDRAGAAKGHPQLGKTVARRTRGEAARHVQGGKRGPWRSGRPGPMCTRQQRGSTAAHSTLTVEKTILQASGRCLADMPDKPPTRHAQRLLCRKKCLINPCDSILSGQMVV
jgi:hypothetical protein